MVAKLCPVYNQRMESTIEKPASSKENKALIETLSHSKMFQDYERAFSELTGLPVTLVPVESWQLPHHCKNKENPFCAMMAKKSRACAACLRVQQQLAEEAQQEPKTVACELGLCDTAVPVRLGERLIGFLRTGQVFFQRPTEAQYNRMAKQVAEWGIQVDRERLRGAYYGTKVLSQRQHAAIVKLLSIFAQHIAIWSNHILTHRDNAEPPMITRAKKYIEDNQSEELSLTQVARAVNTSTFYFCKMFKKATGLNFTDYVSRVRVEKAKGMLPNPNLRVSEIAFAVGFQSLTHFNRVFRKIVGQSPTDYRTQLAAG